MALGRWTICRGLQIDKLKGPKMTFNKAKICTATTFLCGICFTSLIVWQPNYRTSILNRKDSANHQQRPPKCECVKPQSGNTSVLTLAVTQPNCSSTTPPIPKKDDSQIKIDIESENNWTSYPLQECEKFMFPSGHWTRRLTEPSVSTRSRGRQMYATIATQHAIWKHQHPSSCYDKKFIVYKSTGGGHGIGSVLHIMTIILQAALDMDRILVLYPQPGGEWSTGQYCEGYNTLDYCYFEQISSCSIFDAMGDLTPSDENWGKIPWLDQGTSRINRDRVLREDILSFRSSKVQRFLYHTTPKMFHGMLRTGNISTDFYYWWRAQGVAYIVRPNPRTLRELERRREEIFYRGVSIEEGTLSIHVRHGDKWKESKLASDEEYLQLAEDLIRQQPDHLKRKIFLSTEDSNTVDYFSHLTNWTVQWTNLRRIINNQVSPAALAAQIGWDEEFLNSLLNLQLALECDAWVGMLSSNWNRLINELRSTIRCKYDHFYVDTFEGWHIKNYFW